MSLCIIYQTETGGVGIVNPAPSSRQDDETEAAWLERIKARAVPGTARAAIIDSSTLPDRATRARWRWNGGSVMVEPEDVQHVRGKAEAQIDAGFAKVTDINPAVARVHALKREEAEEWLAAVADGAPPDLSGFASLAASAAAMGVAHNTPAEALTAAAHRIVAMGNADDNRLATLDLQRLQAKAAVRAATTPEAVRQVLASLTWNPP